MLAVHERVPTAVERALGETSFLPQDAAQGQSPWLRNEVSRLRQGAIVAIGHAMACSLDATYNRSGFAAALVEFVRLRQSDRRACSENPPFAIWVKACVQALERTPLDALALGECYRDLLRPPRVNHDRIPAPA